MMNTTTRAQKCRVAVLLLFPFLAFETPAWAQTTAFTYQGRLNDAAGPATGSYDLQFSLFGADAGGNSVAGPLSYPATPVSNGLFIVSVDFGSSWFDGSARWLEIAVRTNKGAAFSVLSPRQALASVPYAIRAANATLADAVPAGAIRGAMLADGSVTAAKFAPGAVSQLSAPDGTSANAVSVNTNGYVGIGTNNTGAALQITGGARYSNPAGAVFVEAVTNNSPGITHLAFAVRIFIDGGLAYVSSFAPGSLAIFNITAPQQPVLIGEAVDDILNPASPFKHLSGAAGIFVTNNIAYVTAENDNTVTIMDVSNPRNPGWLAEITNGTGGFAGLSLPTDVLVSGTNCFVASFLGSALTIIDVSVPSHPKLIKEIFDDSVVANSPFTKLKYPYKMALSGTKLYIASRGDNAVTIVDVADPAHPQLVAEIVDQTTSPASPFTKLRNANWVDVVGNTAYVASGAFGNSGSLTIIDVSNPASPVKLSEIADETVVPGSPFTSLSGAWAVKVVGNTAFLTSYSDGGLTAIDVSDPRNPRLAEHIGNSPNGVRSLGSTQGLAATGNTLYVADGSIGALNVFDLRSQLGLNVAGFVGIGVAAPKSALDVAGTVSAQMVNVTGAVQAAGAGAFGSLSSQTSVIVDAANTNSGSPVPGLLFGGNATEAIASKRTAGGNQQGLDFYVGGAARMSIAANGFVGVGTDNPQAPLHIIGHNYFPHLDVAAGSDAPYGAFLGLDATATTGGNNYLIFSTGAFAGEGQGKLVFKNQSTGAYALTADSLGRVGIGTTAPATPLHVASGGAVNTFFDGSSGIGTWMTIGNTAGGLQWNFISTGTNNGEGAGKLLMSPGPSLGGVYGSVLVLQPDGKVGIGTFNPTSALQVVGSVTATAFLTASDRNLKENFTNIDPRAVLDQVTGLPLARWNFKGDPAATHLGPMAQDFQAAFGLGTDDKHIATVDAEGVALAAIQGLNQKLTEALERRDAENAELKRRLDAFEKLIRPRP